MKGTNELHLNSATMVEIVQYWLNSRMTEPVPVVTGFSKDSKGYGGDVFIVTLEADPGEDNQ